MASGSLNEGLSISSTCPVAGSILETSPTPFTPPHLLTAHRLVPSEESARRSSNDEQLMWVNDGLAASADGADTKINPADSSVQPSKPAITDAAKDEPLR